MRVYACPKGFIFEEKLKHKYKKKKIDAVEIHGKTTAKQRIKRSCYRGKSFVLHMYDVLCDLNILSET